MPRHDPTIAADDETALGNVETILLEFHSDPSPGRFSFDTVACDCAMVMADILRQLVRRHSMSRP